jgi:hypothetical protein
MRDYESFNVDFNTNEKLICRKDPVQAIQLYRRRTGIGLKDARNALKKELGMDVITYKNMREKIAFALYYGDCLLENDLSEYSEKDFKTSINHWKYMKSLLDESPWDNGKHRGDCTQEPFTCQRCIMESYYNRAEKILSIDMSNM